MYSFHTILLISGCVTVADAIAAGCLYPKNNNSVYLLTQITRIVPLQTSGGYWQFLDLLPTSRETHYKTEHMPLCRQVSLLTPLVTCRLKKTYPGVKYSADCHKSYAVLVICTTVIVLDFSACLSTHSRRFPVS